MREVPEILDQVWNSGLYIGDDRPMARVTVQRPKMQLHHTADNVFADFLFGATHRPKELTNIESVSWTRSVDQDAAECTVTFWNTEPVPVGSIPIGPDLDKPGYYTFNYGDSLRSAAWGHTPNEWSRMLMPDNLLKTYEGYGFTPWTAPEEDPRLVQTGVWMIDDVEYTVDGKIIVKCRDLIRLLMDHIAFPPVTPEKAGFITNEMPDGAYAYPISFSAENPEPTVNNIPLDPTRIGMSFDDSSNTPYTGRDGAVFGHVGPHAFDDNQDSFWLSIGNARPDQGYSFEWIQGAVKNQTIRSVKFHTFGQGYTAYLSLYVEGQGWIGDNVVPYDPNHPSSAPNGANQPYVKSMHVGLEIDDGQMPEFVLNEPVENVTKVRLTFGSLFYSGMGTYKYRAGVRIFQAFGGALSREEKIYHVTRNYKDYTDIIKLLCAWAGFYWPRHADVYQASLANNFTGPGYARILYSNGTELQLPPSPPDDLCMTINEGRVWGDFAQTGTSGSEPLGPDIFDKKPLIDGVSHIRDIVGFMFYADETGGVVWRPPNIYSIGNTMWTGGVLAGTRMPGIGVQLEDRHIIMSLTGRISSRNVRERTFIGSEDGSLGAVSKGWNPNPTGLRRVGGWLDQNFESEDECQIMADMISLRQLMTYRTDDIIIPGYPKIQVDDQVYVNERSSSDGYVHYVKEISSENNLQSGQWTYTLGTHWLGTPREVNWKWAELKPATRAYLKGLYEGIGGDPAHLLALMGRSGTTYNPNSPPRSMNV